MKKKFLLFLIVLPFVAAAIIFSVNREHVSKKNFTIGIVNPNPGSRGMQDMFVQEMQKYASNKEWQLTFIRCEKKKTLDTDIKNLISQQPDLIFTVTTPGTKKTQKALQGKNIPVVFVMFDPVKSGVIETIARPGGNFTGIKLRGSVPKALDWLLDIKPDIRDIFVPIKFDTKSADMSLGDLKKTAKSLGIRLNIAEVDTKKELDEALNAIPEDTDAFFLLNSIFISTHARTIAETAIRKKLPSAASIGKDQEGVMLTYSTQHALSGKQASRMAISLLQGQSPAETPVENADFYLVINLKTVGLIGLTLSDSILAQADEIIR